MADYINLIGAEDVRSAGHRMASAADTISSAVSNLESVLDRQRMFIDDWLDRLDGVLQDRTSDLGVTMGAQL
jgi:hypothetical protein